MFGSAVLDVAIGVGFVFLFISLICSAIREAIESILKSRAVDLERGLREILSDPTGKTITKDLFDHPLISALFAGSYDPSKLKDSLALTGAGAKKHMPFLQRRNLPSYIPGANFAGALLDITARGAVSAAPVVAAASSQFSVSALRASIGTLPSASLQRAVLSALDYAKGDIDQAKANIEAWFNASMDRVSGWYKRRTQAILFVLGLVAAVALNIDAINVTKALVDDKSLRDAVVAEAQHTVGAGLDAAQATPVAKLKETLTTVGFPIGWPARQFQRCDAGACAQVFDGWILAQVLIGWLITAFATTLGAPFWFDVLSKFVAIRSSGKPPVPGAADGGAAQVAPATAAAPAPPAVAAGAAAASPA